MTDRPLYKEKVPKKGTSSPLEKKDRAFGGITLEHSHFLNPGLYEVGGGRTRRYPDNIPPCRKEVENMKIGGGHPCPDLRGLVDMLHPESVRDRNGACSMTSPFS